MFEATRKDIHARLMKRMADATGTDLEAGGPEAQAVALERCCSCGHIGSCEDWLEDHVDGAEAAPRFCANRDLMGKTPG